MKSTTNKTELLVKSAIVAAIYAVTTMINPLSYLGIQFRISEVLVLLVLIDKRYITPLVIGNIIANLNSPLGYFDIIFGSLATLISLLLIIKTTNLFIATLWPAIVNGLIIGIMLNRLLNLPLLLSIAQVFIGEFVIVSIFGYILFKKILKDEVLISKLRIS